MHATVRWFSRLVICQKTFLGLGYTVPLLVTMPTIEVDGPRGPETLDPNPLYKFEVPDHQQFKDLGKLSLSEIVSDDKYQHYPVRVPIIRCSFLSY